jgi:hypothetical protein
MSACNRSWILAVAVSAALTGMARAAVDAEENPSRARAVHRMLCERLATIWNYRCVQLTPARSRLQFGKPSGPVYDRTELAFDSFGRSCVSISRGLDATSIAWDGQRTVVRREKTEPNGTVVQSASVIPMKCYDISGYNVPWVCLGGQLAVCMGEALRQGRQVEITEDVDRHCRVVVRRDYGTDMAATLNLARGAVPVTLEYYSQGELCQRQQIKGVTSLRGTWFPTEVRSTVYYSTDPNTGEPLAIFSTTRRFADVRINDPEFHRHVEIADDCQSEATDDDFGLVIKLGQATAAGRCERSAVPFLPRKGTSLPCNYVSKRDRHTGAAAQRYTWWIVRPIEAASRVPRGDLRPNGG